MEFDKDEVWKEYLNAQIENLQFDDTVHDLGWVKFFKVICFKFEGWEKIVKAILDYLAKLERKASKLDDFE